MAATHPSHSFYNHIPDAMLLLSVISAYFIGNRFPVLTIIPTPWNYVGWIGIIGGVGLAFSIMSLFRRKHTSTDPVGIPSSMVTQGPFSFSRNPFYLSYVLIITGTAVVVGSLTAFIFPLLCFAVLQFFIIPLEENIMQKKFGQEYTRYRTTTRRWF